VRKRDAFLWRQRRDAPGDQDRHCYPRSVDALAPEPIAIVAGARRAIGLPQGQRPLPLSTTLSGPTIGAPELASGDRPSRSGCNLDAIELT
jgi:hypothetical protein